MNVTTRTETKPGRRGTTREVTTHTLVGTIENVEADRTARGDLFYNLTIDGDVFRIVAGGTVGTHDGVVSVFVRRPREIEIKVFPALGTTITMESTDAYEADDRGYYTMGEIVAAEVAA